MDVINNSKRDQITKDENIDFKKQMDVIYLPESVKIINPPPPLPPPSALFSSWISAAC